MSIREGVRVGRDPAARCWEYGNPELNVDGRKRREG